VPFTIYENKIPQCTAERLMRNRGLCIVKRDAPVFHTVTPNVRTRRQFEIHDGREMIRTWYETPKGTLTMLVEPAGFTTWRHEFLFKSPDDYPAIRALFSDQVARPCYDRFLRAQEAFGEDGIFRAAIGSEPLQYLISGPVFGTEAFCIEWMERRDEVLALYEILVEKRRQVYPIVAQSPAGHANYGGNVTPEIIGPHVFETYYVPHYNEAAEILHRHGKLIGSHFDANCRLLADAIARTELDYIEAFTPAPDTDMTLGEAREAWPDKVLWLNFPSSVHLRPDEEIEQFTVELLNQVSSVDGLIMGITEDIPEERRQNSCRAIMDGLDRHAREHPELYA